MSFTDHYEITNMGSKQPIYVLNCYKCTEEFGDFPTTDAAVETVVTHFRESHPEVDRNS